jgi:hypothetical protein
MFIVKKNNNNKTTKNLLTKNKRKEKNAFSRIRTRVSTLTERTLYHFARMLNA